MKPVHLYGRWILRISFIFHNKIFWCIVHGTSTVRISFFHLKYFFVCTSSIYLYWDCIGLRAPELRNILARVKLFFLQSAELQKFISKTLFNFIHYFKYQNHACNLQIIFHASEYNFFFMGWDPHDRYKIADSFCSSFYEPCLTKYLPVRERTNFWNCWKKIIEFLFGLWEYKETDQ